MGDLTAYDNDAAQTWGEFHSRIAPAHVRAAGTGAEPESPPEPYWVWAEIDQERHQCPEQPQTGD